MAEAGKTEGNDAETETPQAEGRGRRRVKGTAIKRRGALEVTRAISLAPFAGDITFNAKSGEKSSTSLYGTEVHATRYQYGFALTPQWLREQSRTLPVVDAIVGLSEVAGNQRRFLYDFSPLLALKVMSPANGVREMARVTSLGHHDVWSRFL